MEQTYRAARFDQAVHMVKEALGPDALIIRAREMRGEHAGVEVTALPAGPVGHYEAGLERSSQNRRWERGLRALSVPPPTSRRWADKMNLAALSDRVGPSMLQARLSQVIDEEMAFGGPVGPGARVVALVGPTGVGKTTTVAKLAAHAALVQRRKVALVSIDQYRVGGAEQLERYADLIGIPMAVADDARSLQISLRRFRDADLVLVDTAGRSPKDLHALSEMAATLHGVGEPLEVHLCLQASMREPELELSVERHNVLHPMRLCLTKIDEAARSGCIVRAYSMCGLPLSYFTTGQRVPEDIELASAARLAEMLCQDGSLATC